MIVEYQRPRSIQEALALLARENPVTFPMGGGTYLNRNLEGQYAVVDLQALGLGGIADRGNTLEVGATVTLHELSDNQRIPVDLRTAIRHEATYNLRQMATIAGTAVTANGRSSVATVLLAMDARLEVLKPDASPEQVRIGDWLPLRKPNLPGALITRIIIPDNIGVAFESIARSPADQPIVCAAVAYWPSGRTRLALGGWGAAPILAMDGPESAGIEVAARDAYSHANDQWASDVYRQEMAGILALRCLDRIAGR